MELSFQRQKEAFTEADIAMMIRLVANLFGHSFKGL